MNSKKLFRSIVTACAAVALLLSMGASRAAADQVNYTISAPNTALSPYSGPYANVNVNLTSSTTATITFTSLTTDGYIFLFGSTGAVDVNVNASSWTVGTITATNGAAGFPYPGNAGPVTSGGSGNVSDFGTFNQTFNSFDGFQHSSTTITFTLTNTGGTWASAADVLTDNADGYLGAIHGFVCDASDCSSVIVTGFAGDGNTPPVPEPASIALFGSGLMTLAGMIRKRRKQAK